MKNPRANKFTFRGETFEMEDKQKLFCMCYVRNKFNGMQAAIEAGYSAKTARSIASGLLAKPNIEAFVQALKEDIAFNIGVDAIDIAREYKRIGFSDLRQVFDKNGNLINIKEIDDDTAKAISSVEIFEEYAPSPKGPVYTGKTKKLKLYDKVNALDKLAKMIGADGVTKVAATDTKGNDKEVPAAVVPFTDEQVDKILHAVKAR